MFFGAHLPLLHSCKSIKTLRERNFTWFLGVLVFYKYLFYSFHIPGLAPVFLCSVPGAQRRLSEEKNGPQLDLLFSMSLFLSFKTMQEVCVSRCSFAPRPGINTLVSSVYQTGCFYCFVSQNLFSGSFELF